MTIGYLDLPDVRNIEWPGNYLVNSLLSKPCNIVSHGLAKDSTKFRKTRISSQIRNKGKAKASPFLFRYVVTLY